MLLMTFYHRVSFPYFELLYLKKTIEACSSEYTNIFWSNKTFNKTVRNFKTTVSVFLFTTYWKLGWSCLIFFLFQNKRYFSKYNTFEIKTFIQLSYSKSFAGHTQLKSYDNFNLKFPNESQSPWDWLWHDWK